LLKTFLELIFPGFYRNIISPFQDHTVGDAESSWCTFAKATCCAIIAAGGSRDKILIKIL